MNGRPQPLTWNIGTAGKITSRELIPSASGRAKHERVQDQRSM